MLVYWTDAVFLSVDELSKYHGSALLATFGSKADDERAVEAVSGEIQRVCLSFSNPPIFLLLFQCILLALVCLRSI